MWKIWSPCDSADLRSLSGDPALLDPRSPRAWKLSEETPPRVICHPRGSFVSAKPWSARLCDCDHD